MHFHDLDILSNFRPRPSGSFEIAENTSFVKTYLHRSREVFYITSTLASFKSRESTSALKIIQTRMFIYLLLIGI